ncbi:uncharacterized protein TRIVIDRAFT_203368 [Trichoderma virens Gv29-8]|uniref:BTB domain-containing protein n=1 Tax=Hypocrea virens (strain Gv29-8 / FGSC 10586) TaxID=413071 RepID=G9N0A0_HYPVG|nr:uncharacterized protein TRIVIDRAFT_203368 [Trichoderma virens Gv29-8]EHK19782.1 hypothetical protein TRIVIDRAFT_203368 [Trichoderma virens Gv29-8]UKZ53172.1 hypothetical protein TrVGV298_006964 [Trichoderma virens]
MALRNYGVGPSPLRKNKIGPSPLRNLVEFDLLELSELSDQSESSEQSEPSEPSEPLELSELSELSEPPEPPELSEPSESLDAAEPIELDEPAESAASAEAKAAREARMAAAKRKMERNMSKLTLLARRVSNMKRPPSPPNSRQARLREMRKKKSNQTLLSELVANQMKFREKRDELLEVEAESRRIDARKGKDLEAICPCGDVLLAVGSPPVMFQVYSQSLICASPVFEDMVEEAFKKNDDSEKIIWLENENVGLFRKICFVIHHSNQDVPLELSPAVLLNMAVVVERYQLQNAFRFVSRQWLLSGRDSEAFKRDPTLGSGCYMAAACSFDDDVMFERCTQILAGFCSTPFKQLWARAKVSSILIRETGLGCYAKWDKARQENYEKILTQYRPTTIACYPLSYVVVEAKRSLFKELGGDGAPLECMNNIVEAMDDVLRTAGIALKKYRRIMRLEGNAGLEESSTNSGYIQLDQHGQHPHPPAMHTPSYEIRKRGHPENANIALHATTAYNIATMQKGHNALARCLLAASPTPVGYSRCTPSNVDCASIASNHMFQTSLITRSLHEPPFFSTWQGSTP